MIIFGTGFNIATSIIFWTVALVVLLRIIWLAGFSIPYKKINDKTVSLLIGTEKPQRAAPYSKSEGRKVLLFAAAVRLAMLVISFVMLEHINGAAPSVTTWLYASRGWDSGHYITLARYGYVFAENGRNIFLVFFPLYVYLIRITAFVIRNYMVSAYIVAYLSYCFGIYYLYRLVRLDFSKHVAWWAVALISIAPPAFFFGTPMTESLMLLTSAMTLYYIRTHKWALAGAAGALAMFTRMVGAVLIVAAAVEFATHYRVFYMMKKAQWAKLWKLIVTQGLWILLMLAGGVAYLAINWWVSGNVFQFLYYQRTHWHNVSQYFGRTITTQFYAIAHSSDTALVRATFIPNVIAFGFSILMLGYACFKRHNPAYIVYALGYTYMSFSPSWLLSGARYAVVCIPLFIFLGEFVAKKPLRYIPVTMVFLIGLFPLFYVFMRWGPVF